MENKTIPFNGTKEQEERLMAVIEKYKNQDGATIPVLHEAQEIYGYLPYEVQAMISKGLDVPIAEIYGIITFYTQFSLNPKGKYNIGICLGTACYVKGSGDILEKTKHNHSCLRKRQQQILPKRHQYHLYTKSNILCICHRKVTFSFLLPSSR